MEVIDKRGRFVLGEGDDFFGIWDLRAGGEPLERFPFTSEGFDAAEERFAAVRRSRRFRSDVFRRLLWTLLLVGAGLWVIAGVITGIVIGFFPNLEIATVFQIIFVLDSLGYRLAVASLLVIGATFLLGWNVRTQQPVADEGGEGRGSEEEAEQPVERILRRVALAGMAVWVVTAATTETLRPAVPAFDAPQLSSGYVVSLVVETLAFRTWLVALLLLLIRWGRRSLGPRTQQNPPSGG